MQDTLQVRERYQGKVTCGPGDVIELIIRETDSDHYSLAQLDNYMHFSRRRFPCRPPLTLTLNARISETELPGTWGFGLWNDPFSLVAGGGGGARILPVLPNAAWFFYGSSENYLSLRDDLPAKGFHAGTFQSPLLPGFLSLLGAPVLPFLLWPVTGRLFRRMARFLVKEDAGALSPPVGDWHQFALEWKKAQVVFRMDGQVVLKTCVAPAGKLGVVIWVDNQFMRFDESGKLEFGFQKIDFPQTLLINQLKIL